MRFVLKLAGVVLLTAALTWLALRTGRGIAHVPAVSWANAALVSILLLEIPPPRPTRPGAADQPFVSSLLTFHTGPARNWPALLVAGFAGNIAAHLVFGDPLSQTFALSACNTAEAAIAAYTFGFSSRGGLDLTRQAQLIRFVVFAVLLAPLLSSLAAGLALRLLVHSSMAVSLLWFPPSALGMSVVPPLVLGLASRETWQLFHPGRVLNTLAYLVAIAAGTAIIFSRSEFALLFLIIPPLLFLVLRLGISGGTLGCVVIGAIGTDFTLGWRSGTRLLIDTGLEHRILLFQLFLATAVLSVSVVAVVLAELRRVTREIHESELRYRSLAASMQMLATIDPLTHVANRRRFDEALQQEWQRATRNRAPLSLVLFDADFFKAYNDHYGHIAGDECLRRIADKMSEFARRPADLVARFGGEEFGLILPDTTAEGALAWAEQLRQSIENLGFPHPSSPSGLVTVSGGCATTIPAAPATPNDLLHAADSALYEAKRKGRNRVETLAQAQPAGRMTANQA